jgi:uncharacterized UPF0146 family protein
MAQNNNIITVDIDRDDYLQLLNDAAEMRAIRSTREINKRYLDRQRQVEAGAYLYGLEGGAP